MEFGLDIMNYNCCSLHADHIPLLIANCFRTPSMALGGRVLTASLFDISSLGALWLCLRYGWLAQYAGRGG